MLAGYLPFEDDTMKGLFDKIENGEYEFPSHFSSQIKGFISKLLIVDPNKRITILEIMEEEWFKIGFEKDKSSEKIIEYKSEMSQSAITTTKDAEKSYKEKEKISTNLKSAFDLASILMMGAINPLVSANSKIRSETKFFADGSAENCLEYLQKILKEKKVSTTVSDNDIKCFITIHSALLTFNIHLMEITGGFCLVEVRRAKGDILAYNEFYRAFIDNCEIAFVKDKN